MFRRVLLVHVQSIVLASCPVKCPTIAGPVVAQYHLVASASDLALADRLAGFWWVFGALAIASLIGAVVIAVKAIEHLSPGARD
jgi:hypothetical protein